MTNPAAPTLFRRLLLAIGVVAIVISVGWLLNNLFLGELQAPIDFAAFWTGGHLNAAGMDPYSGANVRAVQRELGLDDTAIVMWHPPWTFSLVMPIGMVPFRLAYGIWMTLSLALFLVGVDLLWRGLGGAAKFRGIVLVLALLFGPTVFLMGTGQMTAFVLFGLGGFLHFSRADRPVLAGICVALTAIKPHLLLLFALWLLLEATRSSFGRRVVFGGLLVGVVMTALSSMANPSVWSQYRAAASGPSSADHRHVSEWTPPLIGWWLRQAVPGQPFAVQWLPLAFALPAFAAWWWTNRKSPQPLETCLPWVVGASLIIAPYGAYAYDLVLLLPAILATAIHLSRFPNRRAILVGVASLLCINTVFLAMMLAKVSSEFYVWVTPLVLCGCWFLSRPVNTSTV